MEKDLWILSVAVDSGFLRVADLVAWADRQVLRLDSPPGWLLDLCLAKTPDQAVGTLNVEWNRFMERSGLDWPDPEIHQDLFVGFLYLRFERGEITMAELLNLAGRYADSGGYRLDCETFYSMLNEIDGGGPIRPSDEPLESRVASLFAPMVALVRRLAGMGLFNIL